MTTDFSVPNSLSDVVLIVEGKRLHVTRSYLAVHSEVFHKMLLGKFVEGQQKEVTLMGPENLKYDEFLTLLKILYQPQEEVTAQTCEFLLKLAVFYQIESVLQKCDKFLKDTYDIPMGKKLLLVDNYKLPETKNACLYSEEVKKLSFFRQLTTKPEYGKISAEFKVALFEQLVNSTAFCDKHRNYCTSGNCGYKHSCSTPI